MARLSGVNKSVTLAAGYQLTAPGVLGTVNNITPSTKKTRSGSDEREQQFLAALEKTEIPAVTAFEIDVQRVRPTQQTGARRSDGNDAVTRQGEPAMLFTAAHKPDEQPIVLYTDESGKTHWILGEQRTSREMDFSLPLHSSPKVDTPPKTRGTVGKWAHRTVWVLTQNLAKDIVGKGIYKRVKEMETKTHPYGLHFIKPEVYKVNDATPIPFEGGDVWNSWKGLHKKRALLLLHGTFSSAEASFAQMSVDPTDPMGKLAAHYENRIIAFDHPSLHHDPKQNIEQFLSMVPDDIELDLDIITHSRGGLVGRVLIERKLSDAYQEKLKKVNIHNAIFVAGPNQGTILVNPEHMVEMLDRYTNMTLAIPDNFFSFALEGILLAVKWLAVGGLSGLPGLKYMVPGSGSMDELNKSKPHNTKYFAAAANFDPQLEENVALSFLKKGVDKLIDNVFENQENDLVVPTVGGYDTGQDTPGFPIQKPDFKIFETGVIHTNYFRTREVNKQLLEWLKVS